MSDPLRAHKQGSLGFPVVKRSRPPLSAKFAKLTAKNEPEGVKKELKGVSASEFVAATEQTSRLAKDVETELKKFDMDATFGPCVGISRLKRWKRAEKYGLNPPLYIKELLLSAGGNPRAAWDSLLLKDTLQDANKKSKMSS